MQVPNAGSTPGLIGADRSAKALKKTGRSLQKILEQLATAQRINRASDDAAGLGVSEQLRTQVRGFKMAERNVVDAMAALDIADGTANESASILQRQRELTIQARSDTLTNDQREQLDVEYQQLNQELNRIADAASYNKQGVATGSELASGSAIVQAGANAGEEMTLPQVDISATSLGVGGTSIATAADASNALSVIDTALANLSSQRSTLGATVNRLESTQNNLNIALINTQAAESVLRDQDMAEGLSQLTRDRLLQEGGIRAFSRFQSISTNHLLGLLQ